MRRLPNLKLVFRVKIRTYQKTSKYLGSSSENAKVTSVNIQVLGSGLR